MHRYLERQHSLRILAAEAVVFAVLSLIIWWLA
jgi:hypothetical protein